MEQQDPNNFRYIVLNASVHCLQLCQNKHTFHLPVELLEKLPCVVSGIFWLAWDVFVGSLRLSRFILSEQASAFRAASAEEAALFWCILWSGIDDRGLDKIVPAPDCPDLWDVSFNFFPLDFPVPMDESTLLFNKARCLAGFALMFWVFRWALCPSLSWQKIPVLDWEEIKGCWFSVAILKLLGCDRLKGIGLVHGFFFLAFPCRSMITF